MQSLPRYYSTSLLTGLLITPSFLLAQSARSKEASALCGVSTNINTGAGSSSKVDVLHPIYFVEISEVSVTSKVRLIHTARKGDFAKGETDLVPCSRPNADVDRNSKIVLHFNRDRFQDTEFDGVVMVRGHLEGGSGGRDIEVPGYAVIGKDATGRTSLQSPGPLSAIFRSIENDWNRLRAADTMAFKPPTNDRLEALRSRVRSLEKDLNATSDSVRKYSALIDASSPSPEDTAAVRKRRELERTLQDWKTAEATRQKEVSAKTAEADQLLHALESQYSKDRSAAVKVALTSNAAARYTLQALAEPDNRARLRAWARSARQLDALVLRRAALADTLWGRVAAMSPTDAKSLAEWQTAYDNLTANLEWLATNLTPVEGSYGPGIRDPRARLLDGLRDAEVSLRDVGAVPGDEIVFTISDSTEDGATRVFQQRVRVREYGFVRRLNDAVMIFSTKDESDESVTRRATAARARALDAKSAIVESYGMNARGVPAAGVSLSWTYLPRRDDTYSQIQRTIRGVATWLQPGLGFVVAVPSLPSREVTYSLQPDDPTKTQSTETVKTGDLQYTFGGLVTAFDGALGYSVGVTLNSPKARIYHSIGLSLFSATEKARELFKGLSK